MRRPNPTLIGAFVLGALVLAALAVIAIGGGQLFLRKQHAVIYFNGAVTGLAVGAPVNFRGVRVGEVDDIGLQFDAKTLDVRIPVYISLAPKKMQMLGGGNLSEVPFSTFIARGLRAKLAIQSMVTGTLDVELDFLPNTPAVLVSHDPGVNEIPAVKSDFDVLKDQLSQVPLRQTVEELRDTLKAVRSLAQTANDQLATTAAATRETSAALTHAVTQLQQDSSRTLAAVQKLSEDLDQQVGTLSPQLRETLATAQHALADADATLAHTAELTAPGGAARSDLDDALRNLALASQSLRDFAATIDRNPQALVTGVRNR